MKNENDVQRVTLVKGWAIAAVVLIHLLSSWPGYLFHNPATNFWFVFTDQFTRFSVPVFIGISGYALSQRYADKLDLRSFYTRRVLKLLPLFFLWSGVLQLIYQFVPIWNTPVQWWEVVFFGRGDYHLYFIPLIFQFYVLFPALHAAVKRFPLVSLVSAIALQFGVFFLFYWNSIHRYTFHFLTDQEQYILFISWISYFVMGIVLSVARQRKMKLTGLVPIALMLSAISFLSMVWQAWTVIKMGIDPLYALKFTRMLVIPFGLTSIILAVRIPWETIPFRRVTNFVWGLIGKYSFLIYLSHTLVLRLMFGRHLPGVTSLHILFAVVVWSAAVYITYRSEK